MGTRSLDLPAWDTTTAAPGSEAELWRITDALHGSMDAAEYKHVVPGLIFLGWPMRAQREQARRLDEAIWRNLGELGYGL